MNKNDTVFISALLKSDTESGSQKFSGFREVGQEKSFCNAWMAYSSQILCSDSTMPYEFRLPGIITLERDGLDLRHKYSRHWNKVSLL